MILSENYFMFQALTRILAQFLPGGHTENWNSILSQNFEATAITFRNNSKIIKEPFLNNINYYEGGGTEIEKGF